MKAFVTVKQYNMISIITVKLWYKRNLIIILLLKIQGKMITLVTVKLEKTKDTKLFVNRKTGGGGKILQQFSL